MVDGNLATGSARLLLKIADQVFHHGSAKRART